MEIGSGHLVEKRYLSKDYLDKNQSWDINDSPWKARHIHSFLSKNNLRPNRICEIGCGAGEVLSQLQRQYPSSEFSGFDIAPDLKSFWEQRHNDKLKFICGNFRENLHESQDLILMLDVLEHVADPHKFLTDAAPKGSHFLFHFPLDLSASSVVREKPLLHVRRTVGHIHYFTKNLALELLKECNFEIVDYKYSGAFFNSPSATLKTKIASIPRLILRMLSPDLNARVLGGETLFVLAKPMRA